MKKKDTDLSKIHGPSCVSWIPNSWENENFPRYNISSWENIDKKGSEMHEVTFLSFLSWTLFLSTWGIVLVLVLFTHQDFFEYVLFNLFLQMKQIFLHASLSFSSVFPSGTCWSSAT